MKRQAEPDLPDPFNPAALGAETASTIRGDTDPAFALQAARDARRAAAAAPVDDASQADMILRTCDMVARGHSHSEAAASASMTVSAWYALMTGNGPGRLAYTQARKARGALHADKVSELARDVIENPTLVDMRAAQIANASHQWLASRLDRDNWGDKQTIEHIDSTPTDPAALLVAIRDIAAKYPELRGAVTIDVTPTPAAAIQWDNAPRAAPAIAPDDGPVGADGVTD